MCVFKGVFVCDRFVFLIVVCVLFVCLSVRVYVCCVLFACLFVVVLCVFYVSDSVFVCLRLLVCFCVFVFACVIGSF